MQKQASTLRALQDGLGEIGRSGLQSSIGWSVSWWHVVKVGALILVLALSPSTYDRANRAALARQLWLGTAPILPWFALMAAVISVVLVRIVVVTALGYGLSQFALEMVVRVLVLELIPLAAALFVALRVTVPSGAELIRLHASGALAAAAHAGGDPLRLELMPRVVAGIFAVLLLAAVACLIAMGLTYVAVYGFTFGAFAGFTRSMGKIFEPGLTMIFALKTLFFALAVALIPVAAFLRAAHSIGQTPELDSLVRLFAAILVIEVVSLMGNYY
jgi:phospholipid/cholesterol/gamma-HCH transport system permease protein